MLNKEQIRYYRETYNCGNERVADVDEGNACDCWLLREICDQAILAIQLQAEVDRLKAELTELANTRKQPLNGTWDGGWASAMSHVMEIVDNWKPEAPKAGVHQ